MATAGQAYSTLSQNRRGRIEIPEYNYRDGKLKSQCFQAGWYMPSERRWQKYQRHYSLPPLTRRDAIDIRSEDEYAELKAKLNRQNDNSILGNLPGEVPFVKWNGHKRIQQQPCTKNYSPLCFDSITWDGPGFYGYYHEVLDTVNRRECRPPRPGCCASKCVVDSRVIIG